MWHGLFVVVLLVGCSSEASSTESACRELHAVFDQARAADDRTVYRGEMLDGYERLLGADDPELRRLAAEVLDSYDSGADATEADRALHMRCLLLVD